MTVSDTVTTARTAREALARGLSALQSDPNLPANLRDLAAPIAQAMGALHSIERSGGGELVPNADVALTHARAALGQLQAQPSGHPAVLAAMEAVAASLGLVHGLSRLAASGQAAARPVAPAPAAPPRAPTPQAPLGYAATVAVAASPPAAAPRAVPQAPVSSLNPPPAPLPSGDFQIVPADLGTNSTTNFYKGLSGNDIIDHGGLFVATYMVPKIGSPVRLKVSLPGGYEFEANAIVKWSREQSDGSDESPGFGAQFTQITPEARQLVYRYVRNREPLFHDDF
jgi:hypothetical protein